MRTTLAIDDDVLLAAKKLAAKQQKSVGTILSELARQALQPTTITNENTRNGVSLLSIRSNTMPVAMELVNQLRDELP